MLISSDIVVEVLFNFNGVGRWAITAVLQSDLPVAIGFAMLSCLATVLMSLAADVLYAVADPRVRLY
jgi:peptide/nickel transport system permease protein